MGGLAVNEEVSPMGVCAGTRARSVRISVAMVLTVALAWAVLGVTGAGIAQARSFSDVDSSVSYHLQIQVLSQLGVINGFNDGTFRPDSQSPGNSSPRWWSSACACPWGRGTYASLWMYRHQVLTTSIRTITWRPLHGKG